MTRVIAVKNARKDQGCCGRCGSPITKGMSYRWWKFRYGGKHIRCTGTACAPRSSDLTSSDKLSTLYSHQENAQDSIAEAKDHISILGALEDLVVGINEVAEEYRDSAENIREHFSESATADECEEKADELEGWALDVESYGVDEDEPLDDVKSSAAAAIEDCPL